MTDIMKWSSLQNESEKIQFKTVLYAQVLYYFVATSVNYRCKVFVKLTPLLQNILLL
jgi:hypothetical protein